MCEINKIYTMNPDHDKVVKRNVDVPGIMSKLPTESNVSAIKRIISSRAQFAVDALDEDSAIMGIRFHVEPGSAITNNLPTRKIPKKFKRLCPRTKKVIEETTKDIVVFEIPLSLASICIEA